MARGRVAATRVYRVELDGAVVFRHRHAVPAIAHAEEIGGLVVGSDGCHVWDGWPTFEGDHWVDVTGPRGVAATAFAWLRHQAQPVD